MLCSCCYLIQFEYRIVAEESAPFADLELLLLLSQLLLFLYDLAVAPSVYLLPDIANEGVSSPHEVPTAGSKDLRSDLLLGPVPGGQGEGLCEDEVLGERCGGGRVPTVEAVPG